MGWVIIGVFATLLAVAAVANGIGLRRKGQLDQGTMWIAGAALAWVVLVLGWGAVRSFHSVTAGHVGIVYQFGGIVGQKTDGFQTTWPWQSMREASVQVQRHTFDRLDSFSQETQDVFITATLSKSSPRRHQRLDRRRSRLLREAGRPARQPVLQGRDREVPVGQKDPAEIADRSAQVQTAT